MDIYAVMVSSGNLTLGRRKKEKMSEADTDQRRRFLLTRSMETLRSEISRR